MLYHLRIGIIILIFYDKESFLNVRNWLAEVHKYASDNVKILLVGNKCDLEKDRQVSIQEGQELANKLNIPFIEASARNKMNVNEVFAEIVREMNCNPAKEKRPYCCCNLL